jgi:hypothetical protein
VQTVDKRTLADHGIVEIRGKIDDLDLRKNDDLALLRLCVEIKSRYRHLGEPLTLIVDEGKKKAGKIFGSLIFTDWDAPYTGLYTSSADEPTLQIADLIAFCINRCAHLSLKQNRTEVDNTFIEMVSEMEINSNELTPIVLSDGFTVDDFDLFHRNDRILKKLE